MQRLHERLSAVDRRGALLALMLLFFGFFGYIAVHLSYAFVGVCLLPWALCMTYCAMRKGELRRSATVLLLCAMNVVYVGSSVVNDGANMNWILEYWNLMACAFFPMLIPKQTTAEALKRQLLRMGTLFVVCYLPLALVAMASVFTGRLFHLPGVESAVGLHEPGAVSERIYVFSHPNTTGRFAVFSAMFAIHGLWVARRWPARAFYGFALLLDLMTLAHSQSRTCYIALGIAVGAIAFRAVYLALKGRKLRLPAGLVAGVVVALVLLNGLTLLYNVDVDIATRTASGAIEGGFSRVEELGQFDVASTGRDEIWMAASRYLLDHPRYLLTGLGHVDMIEVMGVEHPEMLIHTNLHSTYFNCLAQCGGVYLLLVLAMLCTLVLPAVRMLVRPEDEAHRGMFIVPVFVGMILFMSIPENMLFVSPGLSNFLFFWLCGYLLYGAAEVSER